MVNKYTKEDKEEYVVSPEPTMKGLFDELTQIIAQTHPRNYPKQFSANSHEAANKFIGLIKFKQIWSEKPKMNAAGNIWVWPFRSRIILLLEKYIYTDDLLRDTIDSAKEMGVDWRGDDFIELVNVMNEHEIMNKIGVKEYRKQAIAKMKSLNMG